MESILVFFSENHRRPYSRVQSSVTNSEAIAQGLLVNLFPDYRVTATDFDTATWLLHQSRTHLPNKVRVMIDFLKLHLG